MATYRLSKENQNEKERIVCAGNQQPNHMHHKERGEDEVQKSLYALIVQIKTDPHAVIKRKRWRANEKGSAMIFFHFLFVPSFHSRTKNINIA